MTPNDRLRRKLALDLLQELHEKLLTEGLACDGKPLLVPFAGDHATIQVLISPPTQNPSLVLDGEPPPTVPIPVADVTEGRPLSASHRRILAKATHAPQSAKELIRAAGYSINSWSRQIVQDLVRWRLLLRLPDGYCLPGAARDVPGQPDRAG